VDVVGLQELGHDADLRIGDDPGATGLNQQRPPDSL
jgi:hypothetical protein